MNDVDIIVFQLARSRVELGASEWLAEQFDAEAMSLQQRRAWFGRVTWCIAGYDDAPEELFAIPKVRSFLAAWRQATPHWLYFGSLENDNLKVLYAALLRDSTTIATEPQGPYQISFAKSELGRLLADDLEVADILCKEAGFSSETRNCRARQVAKYFGFADVVSP